MRRPDARSRENDRPAGVAASFQVREYKVEPRPSSRSFNLLANNDWRLTGPDEIEPRRPEVPLIGESFSFSRGAEGLAGARSSPDSQAFRPMSSAERRIPHSDPGEEVDSVMVEKVLGTKIADGPSVDDPGGNMSGVNEVLQPVGGIRLDLVVKSHCPAISVRGSH